MLDRIRAAQAALSPAEQRVAMVLLADARTFASLPIAIVSYKDRDEDRLAGLEAGATAYLTKSAFQDATFTDVVRDLVPAIDLVNRPVRDGGRA
jgi:CheY-like chemotaxis protein